MYLCFRRTAYNASAKASPVLGFVFDESKVQAEVAACETVRKEYQSLLEEGFLGGAEAIDEYAAALDAAGLDVVLAEAQAQYDAFLAATAK